jgi:hypothetical protein
VALPAKGRLSKTRARRQKERWFKRALRWRAGCETTISRKMKVGPSEPSCRGRLQTAVSCFSQKLRW